MIVPPEKIKERYGVKFFVDEFIEHNSCVITDSEALQELQKFSGERLHIFAVDPQILVIIQFDRPVGPSRAIKVANALRVAISAREQEQIDECGGIQEAFDWLTEVYCVNWKELGWDPDQL